MKIKKFTALYIQDALKQVKKEMGPDAVILSTKSIINGKGIRGVFNRPAVEITAAIDTEYIEPQSFEIKQPYGDALANTIAPVSLLSRNREGMFKGKQLNNNLIRLYNIMIYNGIHENLAFHTIREIDEQMSGKDAEDFKKVKETAIDILERFIKVSGVMKRNNNGSNAAAFIGPTGVGKTATIAKLAAYFTIKEGMEIGFISIDTYRIAAVEQLKAYGQILDIPVTIVFSRDELKTALENYRHKDMVLIDTAGRSHKNRVHMDELTDFFCIDIPVSKHLVLSSVAGNNTMMDTIDKFIKFCPDSLIFSKIDEGASFGSILNSSLRFNLPLSYLTNGQVVPDDIKLATRRGIVEMALNAECSYKNIANIN